MKPYLILAALLPFGAFAQPLNTMNNPNLPDYQIPSQQRMQTQMLNQQSQQKGMLNQQLQTQTRIQQQHLESQINNNSQRVIASQPGEPNLPRQQPLPNSNGGMLNGGVNSDTSLNTQQQHMLPQHTNGSMLNQNNGSTPQPTIPLKTISP